MFVEEGISVLEVGAGAAAPTKALATLFPNSNCVASELSEGILAKARLNCKGTIGYCLFVVSAVHFAPYLTDLSNMMLK